MVTLNNFVNYSNSIIAVANIILIIFIFLQLRDARKPIISTKVISSEREVTEKPNVLESKKLYFVITNNSNNVARSIKVNFRYKFDDNSIEYGMDLDHLNPKEAVKFLLKTEVIRENYTDSFEEITENDTTITIPKETIRIDLIITVRYNPIFAKILKYKIEDNFVIEWESKKKHPNFKDHPVINCWNKREGFYIYKIN
ncbi:MAG: hypothetical protein SVJ22_10645 [Halobacteriota archaeon]|nr:hypothetical protein [Halobacteriota archaeon]